jgi:hypothetical protein
MTDRVRGSVQRRLGFRRIARARCSRTLRRLPSYSRTRSYALLDRGHHAGAEVSFRRSCLQLSSRSSHCATPSRVGFDRITGAIESSPHSAEDAEEYLHLQADALKLRPLAGLHLRSAVQASLRCYSAAIRPPWTPLATRSPTAWSMLRQYSIARASTGSVTPFLRWPTTLETSRSRWALSIILRTRVPA